MGLRRPARRSEAPWHAHWRTGHHDCRARPEPAGAAGDQRHPRIRQSTWPAAGQLGNRRLIHRANSHLALAAQARAAIKFEFEFEFAEPRKPMARRSPGASRSAKANKKPAAPRETTGYEGGLMHDGMAVGAGDGNSTRSLTRLLRTFFPIQASRNGLDCGLKSSAWSTQAVAGDPKRAKHIYQQPEHRISFRSLSVHRHITPQAATDRRAASSKDRLIIDRRGPVFHPLDEPPHGLRGFAPAAQQVGGEHRWDAGQGTNGDVRAL